MNSVHPTAVMTELGRRVWSDPAVAEPFKARIPLRKFAGDESVSYLSFAVVYTRFPLVSKSMTLNDP